MLGELQRDKRTRQTHIPGCQVRALTCKTRNTQHKSKLLPKKRDARKQQERQEGKEGETLSSWS